jgi:hypothetical protein
MTNSLKLRAALITMTCLGSFYVSFRHIVDVALAHGNTIDVAIVYPISIDAVILVSALSLIQPKGVNKKARFWATLGRMFGFAATIYANMLHSGWADTDSVLVNLIPAVGLITVIELLIHTAHGTVATRAAARTKNATPSNVTKLRAVNP